MPDDVTAPVQPEPAQEETNVRDHPAFLAVTKQLAEMRAAIEADKQAKDQASKDAEQKKLEEKGEYEQIISKAKAEVESLKTQNEKQIREMKLKYELAQLGVSNEIFIDGVIARDDGTTDPKEYAARIAEENAALFAVQTDTGITPPSPISPATSGKNNWAQVKSDLNDPQKASAASKAVTDYVNQHGKMPPNF